MDNSKLSADVFLDLAKAFDTISHSVLLKKLYVLGVKGKDLEWLSTYLENREQQTAYKGFLWISPTKATYIPRNPTGISVGAIVIPGLY